MTFHASYVNTLRQIEIEKADALLPPAQRILDIGGGTGFQAKALQGKGHDVASIDLETSQYADSRIFPVQNYDGRTFPFPDQSFDAVFSSNVMEHINDHSAVYSEIRRVLKPNGIIIHILPSAPWRVVTLLTDAFMGVGVIVKNFLLGRWGRIPAYLQGALRLKPHGERGNAITEIAYFRQQWWRDHFREYGFDVVRVMPIGLLYTGNMVLGPRIPLSVRAILGRVFGSSTILYELRAGAARP